MVAPFPVMWGVGGWGVDAAYQSSMSRTQGVYYMVVYRYARIGPL